jgi:hypothetical protein
MGDMGIYKEYKEKRNFTWKTNELLSDRLGTGVGLFRPKKQ